MMTFKDFSHAMYRSMGGQNRPGAFCRELFDNIIECDDRSPLDSLSNDTFKKYYEGANGISRAAKMIKEYTDPIKFSEYLDSKCSDAVSLDLVKEFGLLGIEIDRFCFADDIANLFSEIIHDSITPARSKAREQGLMGYFTTLRSKYNKMKTLLYTNRPVPVSSFYVPNDVFVENDKRMPAEKLFLTGKVKNAIINGTGGIGKSMLMRHLTLELIDHYDKYKKIPILVQLKEYDSRKMSLMDIIRQNTKKLPDLQHKLETGCCMILLDAMDEIRSDEKY